MVLLYSSHGKLIHDGVEKVMEQLSRKKKKKENVAQGSVEFK